MNEQDYYDIYRRWKADQSISEISELVENIKTKFRKKGVSPQEIIDCDEPDIWNVN